jgi:hypothetical protein
MIIGGTGTEWAVNCSVYQIANPKPQTSNEGSEPMRAKNLNPADPTRVSDELYAASIGKLNADPCRYALGYKTRIIHLIDSVSRGYTTPLEAYDALAAPYFPIALELRPSAYAHLIR